MKTDKEPSNDGKARKRSSTASGKPDEPKVKLTLNLPASTVKRLAVHATYGNVSQSELVDNLIQTHCTRYVVSDRLKRDRSKNETGEESP